MFMVEYATSDGKLSWLSTLDKIVNVKMLTSGITTVQGQCMFI